VFVLVMICESGINVCMELRTGGFIGTNTSRLNDPFSGMVVKGVVVFICCK